MDFSTVNYPSVLLATLAACLFGAIYYAVLGRLFMKAARVDSAPVTGNWSRLVTSLVGEFFIGVILYLVLYDITFAGSFSEEIDIASGFAWSVILWAGFVATTIIVSHRRERRDWTLTIVDALHWLIVFVIMGLVIGWFGTPETTFLNGALTI